MSIDLFERILRRFLSSSHCKSYFTIVWHAGEPLAVPRSFYGSTAGVIASVMAEYPDRRCTQAIVTNGTLINDAWCELFKRQEIRITLSLDGPALLHESQRQYRSGRGSYQKAIQGLELMQKHAVDHSVLMVVTANTVKYPNEVYEWAIAHHIQDLSFNPEETEGINANSSLRTTAHIGQYKAFLNQFLGRVTEDGNRIRIREFDQGIQMIKGATPDRPALNTQVAAWQDITVDCDGNFTTFSPELLGHTHKLYGDFSFGNFLEQTLEEATSSDKFKLIQAEISRGVEKCRGECGYFNICRGGAASNKYFETGSFDTSETIACRLQHQAVFDVLSEWIDDLRTHPV